MYKNYIFDLYGTLVDIRTNERKTYLWKKMSEVYAAYGAFYTPSDLHQTYRWLVKQHEMNLPKNGEIDLSKVFAELFERKGIFCNRQMQKAIAIFFRAISRQMIDVYPGVKETLQELRNRGKGIYLLSNAQSDFTLPEIRMLGLLPYFDGIFISSEQGYKKPSNEFFEQLLEEYHLDPKTCLMVGNDESADIKGAKALGMDSLYIHTEISPAEDTESSATYVVMDGDWKKVSSILLG